MATCPCDQNTAPACFDIPAGLSRLPLQDRGFAEVRASLLTFVARQPALDGWSTDGEQDLGVMLLDMWAYVADITRFYDGEITGEAYLGTAQQDRTTRRLTHLLGYKPRPALSAKVQLAVEADGRTPVAIPEGTGFRSEGFDGEPPQVFQTLAAYEARPARNAWAVAPIEDDVYPGRVLFHPTDNGVPRRGILAFRNGNDVVHASQIAGVSKFIGPDDQTFAEIGLDDPFELPDDTKLDQLSVRLMGLTAAKSPIFSNTEMSRLVLDGLYPQLKAGEMAVIETAEGLFAFEIAGVSRLDIDLPIVSVPAVKAPVSTVNLPAIPGLSLATSTDYRLHFNPIRVGRMRAPAKTEITLDTLPAPLSLHQPRVRTDEVLSGSFLLSGQNPLGEALSGSVSRAVPQRDFSFAHEPREAFEAPLTAPLRLFGNVIEAVRGERVIGEVLGSADAAQPSIRFKLKKAPLSWIEDASAETGLRPLLDIFVDGVRWQRVETLYTAGPQDRVYVLETDDEDKTWVVFGDGTRGERPRSGIRNVVADYAFGAGAAKPPPGTIKQLAKPVKGLGQVRNPLRATGGADAESTDDLKLNAPRKALTLGKAVSVQDFTALAAGYPGVLNVASGWAWDPRRQRAVVSIWVIEDGGLDIEELRDWLISLAADGTPVEVTPATPINKTLIVSTKVLADHPAEETRAAVLARLQDETLALKAMPIGGVLYRSALVKAVQTVTGIESAPAIQVDGVELAWALRAPAGAYFDFQSRITVS